LSIAAFWITRGQWDIYAYIDTNNVHLKIQKPSVCLVASPHGIPPFGPGPGLHPAGWSLALALVAELHLKQLQPDLISYNAATGWHSHG